MRTSKVRMGTITVLRLRAGMQSNGSLKSGIVGLWPTSVHGWGSGWSTMPSNYSYHPFGRYLCSSFVFFARKTPFSHETFRVPGGNASKVDNCCLSSELRRLTCKQWR